MEWQPSWKEPLQSYLQRFDGLLGDVRTRRTFQASIKGILAAGGVGGDGIFLPGRRGGSRVALTFSSLVAPSESCSGPHPFSASRIARASLASSRLWLGSDHGGKQ